MSRTNGSHTVAIGVGTAALLGLVVFAATHAPTPPPQPPTTTQPAAAPAVNGPVRFSGPAEILGGAPANSSPGKSLRPPSIGPKAPGAPPSPTAGKPQPAPGLPKPEDLPPGHPPIPPAAEGAQLSLQWLGHSCFYLQSPGGVAAVMDPFDPKATGLPAPDTGAHFVTMSAADPQHGHPQAVHAFQGEKKELLRGARASRGDLKITPVPLSPDDTAYVFETAGLRVAHLGNLTAPPAPEQLRALGAVDILLIPVGGQAITPKQAAEVTKRIGPKVVVPMAYSTAGMDGPDARLKTPGEFIAACPFAVTRKDSDVILVSKPELPSATEIWLLDYRR